MDNNFEAVADFSRHASLGDVITYDDDRSQWQRDRDAAILWAREVLSDPTAVILDTETTSLDGYLVEIGIVSVQGETLMQTLVNPGVPIGQQAQRVHQISDQDVKDSPSYSQIVLHVAGILQGRRVVAYGADFDQGRIFAENERYGGYEWALNFDPSMKIRWECAMLQYSAYHGERKDGSYKRQRLDGGHTAVADCQAALARIRIMAVTPLSDEATIDPEIAGEIEELPEDGLRLIRNSELQRVSRALSAANDALSRLPSTRATANVLSQINGAQNDLGAVGLWSNRKVPTHLETVLETQTRIF